MPATCPRTTAVEPATVKRPIRKPRMAVMCAAGPAQSRTVRSHMPMRNKVLAYISGAPVLRAYSELCGWS